ncbi:MAG: HAD family hydrolase [Pseudonocardiaceae bacterium]
MRPEVNPRSKGPCGSGPRPRCSTSTVSWSTRCRSSARSSKAGLGPAGSIRRTSWRPCTGVPPCKRSPTSSPPAEVAAHLAYLTAEEIRRSAEMVCLPGTKELLTGLPAGRWAVVTSGGRAVARARLASTGLPWPHVLVTADDVERGKPAPECYLLAAARLGILPAGCVVVEDAPAGVRAALAAGMRCIGIGAWLAALLPGTTVASPAEIQLEL